MIFSTENELSHHRFEYWNEVVCAKLADLEINTIARESFNARLTCTQRDSFSAGTVSGCAHEIHRSQRLIKHEPDSSLFITRQIKGDCLVTSSSGSTYLTPGGLAVLDLRQPYTKRFLGDFDQLYVKVPAIELENRLGDISHLVGQVITPNDPLGQLAALSIDELVREKRDSVAAPLSQIVLDLLALSLGRTCTGAAPPVRMAQMRVTWAKATAIGQLRDPSLSVQSIADAQGVSLRLLQRLFAQEGLNLSRFILEQRLDRSRGDLINPYQACRSIAEIARSWGFNDAQYYSRAFRKRFGIAPKEYRHDNKQS